MGASDGTDAASVWEILTDLDGVALPLTRRMGVWLDAVTDVQFDTLDEPSWRSHSGTPSKTAAIGRVHVTVYAPRGYGERHADLARRSAVKSVLADITDIDATDELADRVVRAAVKGTL